MAPIITNYDQFHRTARSLFETEALLANERSYRADLQKQDYIEYLVAHAKKLSGMIRAYEEARRVAYADYTGE